MKHKTVLRTLLFSAYLALLATGCVNNTRHFPMGLKNSQYIPPDSNSYPEDKLVKLIINIPVRGLRIDGQSIRNPSSVIFMLPGRHSVKYKKETWIEDLSIQDSPNPYIWLPESWDFLGEASKVYYLDSSYFLPGLHIKNKAEIVGSEWKVSSEYISIYETEIAQSRWILGKTVRFDEGGLLFDKGRNIYFANWTVMLDGVNLHSFSGQRWSARGEFRSKDDIGGHMSAYRVTNR